MPDPLFSFMKIIAVHLAYLIYNMTDSISKYNNLNKAYGLLCLRQGKIRNSRHGCRELSPEPWMVNVTGKFPADLNVTSVAAVNIIRGNRSLPYFSSY